MHEGERASIDGTPGRTGDRSGRVEAVGAWITRHRDSIERGRDAVQLAAMLAPPPLRLGLAATILALDGAVTFADTRRGIVEPRAARLKGARLAIEGLAMAATARFAPTVLARQAGRLAALRRVIVTLESQRGRAA